MQPASFHPFLHEKIAWLSLLLTLASRCLMICDHTIWLSKNTLNTMPGFLWLLIWLARSWGRKSHTNISSVFLSCAVHNLQVSCSWKQSSNILFQRSWKYFTAACVTCIVQGVTLNFYFEAEGSLSLSHLPKGKSFIFPLPIQGEFTVTQDCYYMINWVKLKWCKPSTLSKTSIYIYIGGGNLTSYASCWGPELTLWSVNFKSAAERHNGRSTYSFTFWTMELQVFSGPVYAMHPIQNYVLATEDWFAHSTTNI